MSFKDFKKKAQSGITIEALTEALVKMNKLADSYKDDRFWYPARDKATKKGSAIIRFLPCRDDDELVEDGKTISTNGFPWVKTYSHSFKNKKNDKWYIEECPTTIGGTCPLCEANSELWNTGSEASQNIARERKRRLNYTSNVLIVDDPATPENNGKVVLYKFGKKIFDKIQASINPEFDDQTPVDVFDMWSGANFALRIGDKDGWTNYDKSEFLAASAISDDDKYLETLYDSIYGLSEFIAPSRFKSYEDLKARLDLTLGNTSAPIQSAAETAEESSSTYEDSGDYDSVDEDSVDSEKTEFFSKLADD